MHLFNRLALLASLTVMLGLQATPVMAQNIQIIPSSWTSPPCDITTGRIHAPCIPMFIAHLVQVVFSVISVFFLINVIYSGYQIALGYINGEKAEGVERLRWSIIGLVVSVCSFLILDLVVSIIAP